MQAKDWHPSFMACLVQNVSLHNESVLSVQSITSNFQLTVAHLSPSVFLH